MKVAQPSLHGSRKRLDPAHQPPLLGKRQQIQCHRLDVWMDLCPGPCWGGWLGSVNEGSCDGPSSREGRPEAWGRESGASSRDLRSMYHASWKEGLHEENR